MTDALRVWVLVELLGLSGAPLASAVLARLPGRGAGLGHVLGLLLVAWCVWMGGLLRLVPYGVGSAWVWVGLLVAAGGATWWRRRGGVVWRLELAAHAVFLVAFAAMCLLVAWSPDVWNTEKPMDMALITSVNRAEHFPPLDPWLAGSHLNYYYLGQLAMAVVIKLCALAPDRGYDVALALLFALTATAVFGLGAALWTAARGGADAARGARRAGVGAVLVVLVAGNLEGARRLLADGGPLRAYDWFAPSRVVPDTINEFPSFSFLLGDLHAHVLALPVIVLALAVCAQVVLGGPPRTAGRARWVGEAVVAGLVVGSLYAISSWSFPVLAGLLALAVAAWVRRAPPGARGAAVAWLVLALVASVVLVAPFLLGFRSATHGLGVVGDRRGLLLWLRDTALMYGPALVLAAVPFLGVRRLPRRVVLGGAAAVVVLGAGLAPFDLAGVVVLLALLGVALWLLLGDRATDPADQVVWLLLAGGLACLLLPEVVYLRDEFDGGPFARMNTAFKFGYHAWVLLGLGGVAALARRRVSLPARGPRIAWAVVAAVVGLGALVYPVAGTWARKDGFAGSPTLDGLGWLRAKAPGDVGAIAWLNDHAPAGSVLLEAVGDDYSADGAARVSTFTGLPTVLGWAGHELQWDHDAGDRRTEVAALYRAASPAAAEPLLRRYRVRYVVAGPLELQTYGTSGVGIWNRLGRVVFSRAGTTVWDLGAR